MQGRMIEVPIVIMLGLAGIAWLTAVSPRIGLAVAGVVAAVVTPSWYSIDLAVEGQQERLSVATTRRRQARKWLDQLGEALGEDRVRDARATLG